MDLNGDGIDDIVSGSYFGDVTIYKGLKGGGFASPEPVKAVFDVHAKENTNKFLYTNPTWGDIDGDGLLDGITSCKIYRNIGSKNEPLLDNPTFLKSTDGGVVSNYMTNRGHMSVDGKSFNLYYDWDNDGVKDLISTHSYYYEGQAPILFHKGVKTDKGMRFEPGIALLGQYEKTKALPGQTYTPTICDYNNDGKVDLVIGVTLAYHAEMDIFDREGDYNFLLDEMYYAKEKEMETLTKKLRKRYGGKNKDIDTAVWQAEADKIDAKYEKLNPPTISKSTRGFRNRGYLILFEGK